MTTCDCCRKIRKDVISCGRDANGDPDAPDVCFLCRKEYARGKVYSFNYKKYISIAQYEYELYGNYEDNHF